MARDMKVAAISPDKAAIPAIQKPTVRRRSTLARASETSIFTTTAQRNDGR